MKSAVRIHALKFLAVLCLIAALPTNTLAQKPVPDGPLRVLFVGNSYIYTNDLPEVVASVAAARGVEIIPGMLAEPNFAIEDHRGA